jgi:hypothetical protein
MAAQAARDAHQHAALQHAFRPPNANGSAIHVPECALHERCFVARHALENGRSAVNSGKGNSARTCSEHAVPWRPDPY